MKTGRDPDRYARKIARALVLALVACAMLAGVALGGTRYFYCAPMEAVMSAPCCDHRARPASAPEVNALSPCCESRTLATVPKAIVDADVSALPAVTLVERIAPPVADDSAPSRAAVPRTLLDVRRTGPPPPRAMSTVFLI